jgi:hypothetical protein
MSAKTEIEKLAAAIGADTKALSAGHFRGFFASAIASVSKPSAFNPPAVWGDTIIALGYAGEPEMFTVEQVRDIWAYPRIIPAPSVIDKTLFTDATLGTSGDALKLAFSRFNPSTETTTTKELELPLASDVAGGLMPAASFAALSELVTDVGVLKSGNRRRPTNTALPGTLSDAQVQTAWEAAGGSASPVDGDTLISFNEDTLSFAWSFFGSDDLWHFRGVDSALPATNSTLGVVRGSTNEGQIFVENDASMSVNGWNNLKNGLMPVGTLLPALNVPSGALGDSWVEFDGGTISRAGNEDVAPLLGDMREWSSEPSNTQTLAQISGSLTSGTSILVLPEGVILLSAIGSENSGLQLLRSTDYGATFSPVTVYNGSNSNFRLATLEWLGAGRVLCGATTGAYYYFSWSSDGGLTWTNTLSINSNGSKVAVACDDTLFLSGDGYVYFGVAISTTNVVFGFYNPKTNLLKTMGKNGNNAYLLGGVYDPDTGVSRVYAGYYSSSTYFNIYYTFNGIDNPSVTAVTDGSNETIASLGVSYLKVNVSGSSTVSDVNIPLRRGNGFDLLSGPYVHKFSNRIATTQTPSTPYFVTMSGYVEYTANAEQGRCARNRLLHNAYIDPNTLKAYDLETGALEDSAMGGLIPAYAGYATVNVWPAAIYDAAPARTRVPCTTTSISASTYNATFYSVMLEPGQNPGLLLAKFTASFTGNSTRLVPINVNCHLYNPTSGDLIVINKSGNDIVAVTYPPLLNYQDEIQKPWASGLIARVK